MIGLNGASLTVLSQQRGKRDEEGLKESLNAFVVILGLLTFILGCVGYFTSGLILRFMGTPETILPQAEQYLQINFLGILFLFGYNFIGTVLRALGDSRTPVQFVLLAVLLNAVLNPIFISVFGWGIAGAAYATVISQGAAFLYGVLYSLSKGAVPFSVPHIPPRKYSKAVFKLGLPGGFQMVAVSSGMVAIMAVIASFGESVVAGFGAAQRIDQFIMLPALTLGSSVNSMSGQNIGAGRWDRVRAIAKSGTVIILVLSVTINTMVFFFADRLVGIFVDDPDTIAFGTGYLRTVAFFYPFLGVHFILNGIIRSSGAMFQVLVLNIISFWVLRFPLTYLGSRWFGEQGIGLGIGMSLMISLCISSFYFFFGNWKQSRVFDE